MTNLADWLGQAKDAGAWIYGAEAEAESPYTAVDLSGKAVLVLGSEGSGAAQAGRRSLRRAGLDPGPGQGGFPERLGGGGRPAVRGGPPARALIGAGH